MILTNNTQVRKVLSPRSGDKYELRKFELIAEHDDSYWVKALNGNYIGELLTFKKSDLQELT